MDITVEAVEIKDGKPVIKYSDNIGDGPRKCFSNAHSDLLQAIDELTIHMAFLAGFIYLRNTHHKDTEEGQDLDAVERTETSISFSIRSGEATMSMGEFQDDIMRQSETLDYFVMNMKESEKELLEQLQVTGMKLVKGCSGVVILGARTVPASLKEIDIATPEQLFKSDIYGYKYSNELALTIEKIKYECIEYLVGNKKGTLQGTLDFGGEVKTEAEPEKPKGRRGRPAKVKVEEKTDENQNEETAEETTVDETF